MNAFATEMKTGTGVRKEESCAATAACLPLPSTIPDATSSGAQGVATSKSRVGVVTECGKTRPGAACNRNDGSRDGEAQARRGPHGLTRIGGPGAGGLAGWPLVDPYAEATPGIDAIGCLIYIFRWARLSGRGLGVWLCLRKLRRFFAGLSGVLYAILSPAVIAGIAGLGSIMLPINIGIPREPSSLTSPERL
jgi:hypothetical protein